MIYLSPQAYHKIKTAIEFSTWEVGFYGVTEDDDITRVLDVYMPIQKCNDHRNEFDDADVNRYVANQLKKGLTHRQLTSVWIHTHPEASVGRAVPLPSKDDKEMHEAMVECGVGVSVMIILTKSAIKAWVKAKVPGLKRVIESEEDVNVDWLMDAPEKFRVDKWRKRYERVVSHLEPEPVVPVVASGSGGTHRKCIKCHCWRPSQPYSPCSEQKCYLGVGDICEDCRAIMGGRCSACYEKYIFIREANKALCGNKAQPRLPLIDTQGYELTVDDPPVESVHPDNPPANKDNPDCDNRCYACPMDPCPERYEEYDPSAECDADCCNCIETFCLERDQVPSDCRCLGNCANCSVTERCEWKVSEKNYITDERVNVDEDK
jgi:hypothetical protein